MLRHFLGPLHMSPVDWADSVSEISPHHYFLCKNFNVSVHMRRRAGLVTEISVFPTKIFIGNRAGNFPIWTGQPGCRDEKNSNMQAMHFCPRRVKLASFCPFSRLFYCKMISWCWISKDDIIFRITAKIIMS